MAGPSSSSIRVEGLQRQLEAMRARIDDVDQRKLSIPPEEADGTRRMGPRPVRLQSQNDSLTAELAATKSENESLTSQLAASQAQLAAAQAHLATAQAQVATRSPTPYQATLTVQPVPSPTAQPAPSPGTPKHVLRRQLQEVRHQLREEAEKCGQQLCAERARLLAQLEDKSEQMTRLHEQLKLRTEELLAAKGDMRKIVRIKPAEQRDGDPAEGVPPAVVACEKPGGATNLVLTRMLPGRTGRNEPVERRRVVARIHERHRVPA
jgi:DNA repair exonuclease SbcCD ATPase subunit